MKTALSIVLGLALLMAARPSDAMNKAELTEAMASGAGISKADAKKALDAFIDTTSAALKKGDRVALVGFGSFSISRRRIGRNPQTGKGRRLGPGSTAVTLAGSKVRIGQVHVGVNGTIELAFTVPSFMVDADGLLTIAYGGRARRGRSDKIVKQELTLNIPATPINDAPTVTGRRNDTQVVIDVAITLPRSDDDSDDDGLEVNPLFRLYSKVFHADLSTDRCAARLLAADLGLPASSFGASCEKSQVRKEISAKSSPVRSEGVDAVAASYNGVDDDCDSDVGQAAAIRRVQTRLMEVLDVDEAAALRVLDALAGFAPSNVKKGDKVVLVGFGTFSSSRSAARTGRNPQTGKEIQIRAKNVVKFKAGSDLSSKVN